MRTNARRAKVVAGVLLMIALTAVAGWVWRTMAFRQWVTSDAGSLAPYQTVLVQATPEQAAEWTGEAGLEDLDPIDRELVRSTSLGRMVVHLSRSDYRSSLTGRQRWVKVYLETRQPGRPEVVRAVKFLNRLGRDGDGWRVETTSQLALQ